MAKSELLLQLFELKGEGGGEGRAGNVQHACMYISELFLNVKAVHFWGVLNFFGGFGFFCFFSCFFFFLGFFFFSSEHFAVSFFSI